MEVFTGASKVKIGNNNISSVGRDQNNNYYTQTAIVQTRGRRKVDRSLPELSEFTEIKRGDIHKSKDGVCYSWRLYSNGKDDTEAAVYHAEVNITGSFRQKFTVKTYRGRNAMKEWRRDFSQCSKDWLRDIPLFGYNKSAVPSLIFSGELVPLAHMEARMGWAGLYYMELLRASLGCSRNELWMDPTQGRFCRGPIGPKCRDWQEQHLCVIVVPSDVEFLKEDVAIRYFTSKQDDRGLFYMLIYSCHSERLDDITNNRAHVVSSLTNSAIAFIENVRWWSWMDCLGKRRAMPDGATRFRLRDDRRKIYVESVSGRTAWLPQALSVFHAHNITLDEDLCTYKLVFPVITLTGALQKSKHKRQRRQSLDTPIYLIFLPSPDPVYHWSLDPIGQTPLSPEMCQYLGLPFKLSLQVIPYQLSWPNKVYKQIHEYQISRKFDPKTTDLAQSLQCGIFDVVPAQNRFQEIVEGQNEVPAESEGVPSLPMVKNDSESVLCSNGHADHVDDLGGLNDSFSLDSLFYETEGYTGCTDISHPSDDVGFAQSGSAAYTQQVGDVMRWIWGTLFAPSTLEVIEGLDISAAAI